MTYRKNTVNVNMDVDVKEFVDQCSIDDILRHIKSYPLIKFIIDNYNSYSILEQMDNDEIADYYLRHIAKD